MGFDIDFDLGDSHIFVQQVKRLSELLSRSTLRERERERETECYVHTRCFSRSSITNKALVDVSFLIFSGYVPLRL